MNRALMSCLVLLLGAADISCIPKGRYVPFGIGDLVDSEYIDETIQREQSLNDKIERLQRRNLDLEKQIAKLQRELDQKTEDSSANTQRYQRNIDLLTAAVVLYLGTEGVDISHDEVKKDLEGTRSTFNITLDILDLSELIRSSKTKTKVNPTAAKEAIKRNYLNIEGCGGLLLTAGGYLVTANHCFGKDGQRGTTTRYSHNNGNDIALAKVSRTREEFGANQIYLAPKREIKKGTKIVTFGNVGGENYLQMGRIINPDSDITLDGGEIVYDAFQTDTLSKGGFSGGPVYDEQTGKLVGITLFGDPLGGGRADKIVEIIEFERKWLIKQLKDRYGSR